MVHGYYDDEYDPLSPALYWSAEEAEEEGVPDVPPPDWAPGQDREGDPEGEFGVFGADGGVGAAGLVRLWFDGEGCLDRVRVSPVWFKKLKRGQTLDQAFMQAFAVSGYSVGGGDVSGFSAGLGGEDPVVELPDMPIEEYVELMRGHALLRREAMERALAEPVPQAGPVVGRFAGVTIWLGSNGHPEGIEFDEDWLDDAQVGAICAAVERAARDAFSRYREVADDRFAEVERLDEEYRLLRAGLNRYLEI